MRKPPSWDIVWHTWHDAANLGPPRDLLKRGINSLNELDTEADSSTVVPNGGIFEFGRGFGFGSESPAHLSVNRWRTRARMSSQGSPADSPLITRRARRSIS